MLRWCAEGARCVEMLLSPFQQRCVTVIVPLSATLYTHLENSQLTVTMETICILLQYQHTRDARMAVLPADSCG